MLFRLSVKKYSCEKILSKFKYMVETTSFPSFKVLPFSFRLFEHSFLSPEINVALTKKFLNPNLRKWIARAVKFTASINLNYSKALKLILWRFSDLFQIFTEYRRCDSNFGIPYLTLSNVILVKIRRRFFRILWFLVKSIIYKMNCNSSAKNNVGKKLGK